MALWGCAVLPLARRCRRHCGYALRIDWVECSRPGGHHTGLVDRRLAVVASPLLGLVNHTWRKTSLHLLPDFDSRDNSCSDLLKSGTIYSTGLAKIYC